MAGGYPHVLGEQQLFHLADLPFQILFAGSRNGDQQVHKVKIFIVCQSFFQEIAAPDSAVDIIKVRVDVVGQRGKTINTIIEQTGVKIDISDDGFVSICGTDQKMMDKACEMIKIITTDFEAGQVFKGKVVSIKEFGAFLEFAPGKEGMVHISKIAKERINHVEDVLTLGDVVTVVCLGRDKMGRISFSMKDVAQQ